MGVLLYYPTVNPPTEIVHQALLYWDGVASVVPRDPRVYRTVVSDELRRLEDRELYRPLAFTEDSLERLERPDWSAGSPLAGQTSSLLAQELRRMAARPDPPRPASPPEAVLYTSKVSYWLRQLLVELGLARRGDGFHEALAVSTEVQTLIVGVLARELAGHPDIALFPYTDSEHAYRASLRAVAPTLTLAWEMELGRLLPVPAPGTPTSEVIAFREKYADERIRLMRAVHRMLGELRRDYEHPADVFAQLRVELSQAVLDYRAAGRGSRLAWVHRSVTASVALAAAAGGTLLMPNIGWLLGTVGGYALNVATREIRPLIQARDEHDFSYLHRVDSTLS
ncbi:hypothetical protein GA0115240_10775 [Streptomyces sp. DvalAA-14]|uniref:hypothetical protein n=1 Tax=unclassified Streptomyces TaxID=2593676 RepID=UPI00081B473E|nr:MULTISPECIES: hypothetical protein [unclassified Streptomyces]MYS19371.1 hypothetical protein [Streptomyces sp. SID4948]SCD43030.1 hypothetical protein GA0115240_10775 [Streptomyces sp. DvalAA-14]